MVGVGLTSGEARLNAVNAAAAQMEASLRLS